MFLFIGRGEAWCRKVYKFKYILCSYSSDIYTIQECLQLLFKYILCSYSSHNPFGQCRILLHIQIHPMFLFIQKKRWGKARWIYSNTSYVLIHLRDLDGIFVEEMDSNTSYVLIHLHVPKHFPAELLIQIHPMFLFIPRHPSSPTQTLSIQIHPMFLFIYER